MSRNVIDDDTKRKIAAAYELMTAKAVASEYGISERQVRRIAKEVQAWDDDDAHRDQDKDSTKYVDIDSLKDAYGHGISTDFIKTQYLSIYEAQMKAAEHYHKMAVDEKTKSNCAWGNLELHFLQDASKSLYNIHLMSGSHRLETYDPFKDIIAERQYQSLEREFNDLGRRQHLDMIASDVGRKINWDVIDSQIEELHRYRDRMDGIDG